MYRAARTDGHRRTEHRSRASAPTGQAVVAAEDGERFLACEVRGRQILAERRLMKNRREKGRQDDLDVEMLFPEPDEVRTMTYQLLTSKFMSSLTLTVSPGAKMPSGFFPWPRRRIVGDLNSGQKRGIYSEGAG